jgi:hypothetical protein
MQLPIGPDPMLDKRQEGGNRVIPPQHGLVLSLESQLQLRELFEYVETCRTALNEIQADLSLFEANPECSQYPGRVVELLGDFCVKADSWGFNDLYEIALGLQVLLLNSGGRMRGSRFREALDRGMATLSDLLERCEGDFRRRLAVTDTLDCLYRAARN